MTTKLVNGVQVVMSAQEEQALLDEWAANDVARTAVTNAATAEVARQAALKVDVHVTALVSQLKTATASQIDTYVTNNVTDLASARIMLTRIIKVLAVISRQIPNGN